MIHGGAGESLPEWYPAPLSLPAGVESVADYIAHAGSSLVVSAPSLPPETIRQTCPRIEQIDAMIASQEALKEGRFSDAIGLVAGFYYQHLHAAALYALAGAALMRLTAFAAGTIALQRLLGVDERPSLYRSLAAIGSWLPEERPELHPEADAMSILCDGVGIDVGCGAHKTVPWAIGVVTTGDKKGEVVKGDITSPGDDLPMFADDSLDFVVARRNYEQYQDPVAPLIEWARILKPGGRLGIVSPDHDWVDTISLDLSHRHAYNRESLARIVGLIPSLRLDWSGPVIPRWSVGVVAVKRGGGEYHYADARLARELARLAEAAGMKDGDGRADEADQCRAEADRLRKGGL